MHPRSLFTSRPHLLRKDVVSSGHASRSVCCSVLQCVAVCCSVLQCVAVDVVSCGHASRSFFASSSTHPRPHPHTPSIDTRSHVLTYDMYSHQIPSTHTRPHPHLGSIRTKIPLHTTTPTHAVHSHQDPKYHGRPRAHTSSIHTKTSRTHPTPHQRPPPIHTKP